MKEKCVKFNEGIGIIKKLQNKLPRQGLLTIYKSFVRPHLDYGDQYSAALAIEGAIKGTSQTEIFKLESLKFRRYFRRLCTFIKIKQSAQPSYLYNLIPKSNQSYNTRQFDKVERFYCRTDIFKKLFFPSIIDEWNKFKPEIRTIDSFLNFRKLILNLDNGRPLFNPIYNIFNPIGLKYFTRFLLELSHLI